jgi:hypothetical protein
MKHINRRPFIIPILLLISLATATAHGQARAGLGSARGTVRQPPRTTPSPPPNYISSPPPKPAPPPPPPGQEYAPSRRSVISQGAERIQARRQPYGYGSFYGYDSGWYDDDDDRDDSQDDHDLDSGVGSAAPSSAPARPYSPVYSVQVPAELSRGADKTPQGGSRGSPDQFARDALSRPPDGAEKIVLNNATFYRSGEQYYRPFFVAGETVYYAVPAPAEPSTNAIPALLEAMCRELAGAARFSASVLETREETVESGETVQLSGWRTIHLSRPAHLRSDVSGDEANRELWFNGQECVWLDKDRKTYARLAAPGPVDRLLELLARHYDLTVPLAGRRGHVSRFKK